MFCEQVANGKQYLKNTEQAAVSIDIFKNGKQRDSLKEYGPKVWNNMTSWRGSAGNGRVWTAVW